MKVVRQIVYESESQEALDDAIGRSMNDGVREYTPIRTLPDAKITMTIRTLHDERAKVDEFPDATAEAIGIADKQAVALKNAGLPPCMCNVCKAVRARRAAESERVELESQGIDASMDDEKPTTDQPEYHPTRQDESDSTEGAN